MSDGEAAAAPARSRQAEGGGEGRRILHCDMDAFYASIHIRDDPSLAGKPVVIGGTPEQRGVVAAASYEARKYGIHSAMPSARAHRLCPEALFLPPDFRRYRRESQRIFAIFREFTPLVQTVALDEAYLDVSERWQPWGSATGVAEALRRRIREELQLTVSVGVGPNRLVAKIASDFDKPDGLTVVRPHRVQAFLDPLPARRLPGVGPATERRLAELGVHTVRDLRTLPRERLLELLGRNGERLHDFAHGRDDRPVCVHQEAKSLSCERTWAEDIRSLAAMDERLTAMAEKVAAGLERRQLSACTVTVKARYPDFTTMTRSATLDGPTRDPARITEVAHFLLRRTEAANHGVRLLGVGASNLVPGSLEQLTLFGG
ncbi:MAG: DNA polymerase IV [Thermoanaerobaculia bacterium]